MTTIAYRDNVMAADTSCLNSEGTNEHGIRKVWRVHGCLVGCSGAFCDIQRFIQWLKEGAYDDDTRKVMEGFDAIVVQPSGRISTFDGYTTIPIRPLHQKYIAIGSGGAVALGAMFAGADAITAVKAAVRHNIQTKAPIRSYRL